MSLKNTFLEALKYYRDLIRWTAKGRPFPPPHRVKQRTIRKYHSKYRLETLVESGTFMGDMMEAQLPFFRKLISIELSKEFFEKAVMRFKDRPSVMIMQGDSGEVIKSIVPQLDAPALFWLDGHYSGADTAKSDRETPVMEELQTIFSSAHRHVVLIDDARLFIGEHDYPTLASLGAYCEQHHYAMSVKNDIIRLVPKGWRA